MKAYDIAPCPAPRQTRRDTWNPSPSVQRYRAFRDEVKLKGAKVPEYGGHVIFVIAMPKSWSKKKREEMALRPHQQKPDKDNLEKALLDAIYRHSDDSHVYDMRVTKIWARRAGIIIYEGCITSWYDIQTEVAFNFPPQEAG